MAMLIPVTQMNDVGVLVGLYGIKMIEATTYTPEKVDKKLPPAKDGAKVPETTQKMAEAPPDAIAPIVCTKITFHDDKSLVVKETMDVISTSSARP